MFSLKNSSKVQGDKFSSSGLAMNLSNEDTGDNISLTYLSRKE